MTAYLLSLCLHKKKEEENLKKEEERKRKRFSILSLRLQNEAMEKKLMGKEDKFQYGSQLVIQSTFEDPLSAILLLKSLRIKEKEKRMCYKDKERDKERNKNKDREKKKYIKEIYDNSDKEEDKDTRKDREDTRKEWGSEDKIERKCKVSQEVTEAMISRLTSKSRAIDQEYNRTTGRRSGVEGDSGSGTECIAARDFNDWKKKNAVPTDSLVRYTYAV